jgi:hypothetical protein
MAVVMPFTAGDVGKVIENLELWRTYRPCARRRAKKPALVFYSNAELPQESTDAIQSAYEKLGHKVTSCFQGELQSWQSSFSLNRGFLRYNIPAC